MSVGWKLDRDDRTRLLGAHPPVYRPVADHVTVPATDELPQPARIRIVGRVDDGEGVEAMVVEVDGGTARPDGGTWHITWSLAEGRRAKESNNVIAECGWQVFDGGAVRTEPARWD